MCADDEMAIVIVNYNTCALLRDCLQTVVAAGVQEVLVVDSNSDDDSVAMVRREFPAVQLLLSPVNLGYGAAANLGVRHCRRPFILLLNSDTLIEPQTPAKLTNYLRRFPHVAAATPQLINPDGSKQPCAFPSPSALALLMRESGLKRLLRPIKPLRERYLEPPPGAVNWVLGAAMALRRSAFESVNGFDEAFFMYFEEVDMCYRLRAAGWEVHYAPVTRVTHIGGGSTQAVARQMTIQLYRSHLLFARRHFTRLAQLRLRLALLYVVLRNYVRDSLFLRLATVAQDHNRLHEATAAWSGALSLICGQEREQ